MLRVNDSVLDIYVMQKSSNILSEKLFIPLSLVMSLTLATFKKLMTILGVIENI